MHIDDFFQALATCKHHFAWRQPTATDPEIRGVKCRGLAPGRRAYCPITAVASHVLRRRYDVFYPEDAAGDLSFADDEAVIAIVIAADAIPCEEDTLPTAAMRARLLTVLGLQEVAS